MLTRVLHLARRLLFIVCVSRDKLTVLASKKDNPAEQIFVFWADEEKLGVAPVKKCVDSPCAQPAAPRAAQPMAPIHSRTTRCGLLV